MASSKIETTIWHGCYESGWKGVITPESFAHPAKFSRSLIKRIFSHCLERGYIRKGETVGDCFGGIGTGGIMAAYQGIEWIGCELEKTHYKMKSTFFNAADFHAHFAKYHRAEKQWFKIFQLKTHLSKGRRERRGKYWMRQMERCLFRTPHPPEP